MRHKRTFLFPLILLSLSVSSYAQLWSGILSPTHGTGACTLLPTGTYAGCGVDWTQTGVPGGIPSSSWTQSGSTITSTGSDQTSQIQTALKSCGTSHYVLLASGTFVVSSTLTIPSNCELRGAGANLTILKEPSSGVSAPYIVLGSTTEVTASSNPPTSVTGATAGSTSVTLGSTTKAVAGGLMFITELNNPTFVDIGGDESGSCTFCYIAYNWGDGNGSSRVRGQLVHLDTVNTGTGVVTFDPPLMTDYGDTLPAWQSNKYYGIYAFISNGTHYYEQTANIGTPAVHCLSGGTTPTFSTSGGTVTDGNCTWLDKGTGTSAQAQAIAFSPAATYAGVSNLQVYDQDGGGVVDIYLGRCMYCWVVGSEVNYTDADWTEDDQGFRNTIQSNYFSNAYLHTSGAYDSTNMLISGTSGDLFINNICERGHIGCIDPERGVAGNVFAYNYATGAFDGGDPWSIPSLNYHGAHSQFNLSEGNVWAVEHADGVWGSTSHHTSFRNWLTGTNSICSPSGNPTPRGTVTCTPTGYPEQSGANQFYSFQNNSPIRIDFSSSYFNLIGDVLGSTQAQALKNESSSPISQRDAIVWSSGVAMGYGCCFYGETLGLSYTGDAGSFPVDNAKPSTSSLFHGIYQNVDGSTTWQTGIMDTLPASFFLSTQPSWWTSSIPWPAIGPDLTSGSTLGGHVYSTTAANPAQNCYFTVMGGTDGGAGSPLTFNANTCYPSAQVSGPPPPTGLTAVVK